jgi:hypothetical protein
VKASTPKEALMSLASAMKQGNADSIRALVHVEHADDQRLVDAACDYTAATVSFKDSIAKKFGADAQKNIFSPENMPQTPLEQFVMMVETMVPKAEVELDGNEAVITVIGDEKLFLIQEGPTWQVHAGKQVGNWTPDQREERASGMERLTGMIEQLAIAVETDRFASEQELIDALKQMFGR